MTMAQIAVATTDRLEQRHEELLTLAAKKPAAPEELDWIDRELALRYFGDHTDELVVEPLTWRAAYAR